MIEQTITHHIQKHIIGVLMNQESARFRDMRPPKCDTNLYSYHLKLLTKRDFVEKADDGYRLGKKGMVYVDRLSLASLNFRTQPKIITMLVVQNSNGDVLLFRRKRHPFLGKWTLPMGKVHIDDSSVVEAVQREASEKLGLKHQVLEHVGDCYIRIHDKGAVIMSTLVHVCKFNSDAIAETDTLKWARPHKLANYDLAPAVEQIITRTFFGDEFFFEEYATKLVE